MVFYKITWDEDIKEVEVERETEKCVWINGYRFSKISEYECFFKTKSAAYQHLIARVDGSIDRDNRRIVVCNKAIVKNLEKKSKLERKLADVLKEELAKCQNN